MHIHQYTHTSHPYTHITSHTYPHIHTCIAFTHITTYTHTSHDIHTHLTTYISYHTQHVHTYTYHIHTHHITYTCISHHTHYMTYIHHACIIPHTSHHTHKSHYITYMHIIHTHITLYSITSHAYTSVTHIHICYNTYTCRGDCWRAISNPQNYKPVASWPGPNSRQERHRPVCRERCQTRDSSGSQQGHRLCWIQGSTAQAMKSGPIYRVWTQVRVPEQSEVPRDHTARAWCGELTSITQDGSR